MKEFERRQISFTAQEAYKIAIYLRAVSHTPVLKLYDAPFNIFSYISSGEYKGAGDTLSKAVESNWELYKDHFVLPGIDVRNQLAALFENLGLSLSFDLSYQEDVIIITYIKNESKFGNALSFILDQIASSLSEGQEDYSTYTQWILLQESLGDLLFRSISNANFALRKLHLDPASKLDLEKKMLKILDFSFLLDHEALSWFDLLSANIGVDAIEYTDLSVEVPDLLSKAILLEDYPEGWKRDIMANYMYELSYYAINLLSMNFEDFKKELQSSYAFYILQLGRMPVMDKFLKGYFLNRIYKLLYILKLGKESDYGVMIKDKRDFAVRFYAKIEKTDLSKMTYSANSDMLQ